MATSKILGGDGSWLSSRRGMARELVEDACPFPGLSIKIGFTKGQNLYHQGDLVAGAYSLASGMVAMERVDQHGDMVILKVLQPGAFFPCAQLPEASQHDGTARALTDVCIHFIPRERLRAAMRSDPSIGLRLLRLCSAEIRENEATIFRLYRTDLPDRVMAALTALADELGETEANGDISITLPFAWRDLAAMVGTGPEVISRLLRRLADSGRLSFHGRHVTLHRQGPAALPTLC
ncbi:cAMP-binding protein [Candidatus Terasakiella magnetica]|nr:cAMP-binding protein [Candidatus Terasakiella magnetica]